MRAKIPLEQATGRTLFRRRREAGLTRPILQYSINEDLFSEWSPELAWILGLIWSDGNLFRNTIEICSKDFQLIELINVLVGGRYNLKNNGEHLRIYFTSKKIAIFLRRIGLTERKSLTACWPLELPNEYSADFMRGLIDGDGSVISRLDRPGQQVADLTVDLVTASVKLKDDVFSWFVSNNINFYLKETRPNFWRFQVKKQVDLRKLYALLYPTEDVPCLHRKRIPFDNWMIVPRARPGRPKKPVALPR